MIRRKSPIRMASAVLLSSVLSLGSLPPCCDFTPPLFGAEDTNKDLLQKLRTAQEKSDHKAVVQLLDQMIGSNAKDADALYQRGRAHFQLGNVEQSVADFDRFVELRPSRERSLWERGISQYYAKKYDQGAKQFALYQTYRDSDVENSVWRYLCMAQSVGLEKARASMLKIKNDRRVPFMEIYRLYQGKLKPNDVMAAAKAGNPSPEDLNRRLFYSHLYLGLYHEAAGNAKLAKEHLITAADRHKIGHYMWDVAKVHADRLRNQKNKTSEEKD